MRAAQISVAAILMTVPISHATGDPILAVTSRPIVGSWVGEQVDEVPAPGGGTAFLRRSLVFTVDRETLKLEAFLDAEQRVPLFTYESEGPYRVVGPSASVPGAVEIDLTNDMSLVTIHREAPEVWRAINLGACPLVVGQAVEVSTCAAGPPFNTSRCVDQDLLHLDDTDRLRFGDQSVDRCAGRPTALDRAAYLRHRG